MPRTRTATAITIGAALLLAACGGGGDDGEVATAEDGVLAVVGQDDLTWDVEELAAEPGTVEFELTCEEGVEHNLAIEELDEEVVACDPGETATGSLELEEGEYTYICTVPGHEQTMRGTLTVG